MAEVVRTIRVMATHPSQGEFVVINEAQFDPAVHKVYDGCQTVIPPATATSAVRARGRSNKQHSGEQQHGNS